MSKVVKAVAVGALIGITGGAAIGFLAPGLIGAAAGAGAVFGGAFAPLAGALAGLKFGVAQGLLAGAAAQFTDKPSMGTGEARARLTVSLDPQALGKWAFGETPLATDLVYAEKVDEAYVVQVMAGAAHLVHEFGTLYINDETVSFSGAGATGDWAGVLSRYTNLGTETQTHLLGEGSWPATADGLGIAHYKFDWTVGEDKIRSGIPTRVTQVAKGAPVYDPRLDSTRGGSGTHRADDQSTWEYQTGGGTVLGANWALVVAFYLLGWRHDGNLVFGVGVDPDDVDWDSVIAAANVCDETVDSKPRFRVGGMFATTNDHERIVGQLEAAIGGKVAIVGGKYYVWAPNDDLTSQGTITEAKILRQAGVEFSPSGPIEGLYNTCRGRYVSPDDLYQLAPYPEVVESAAVTEDGRTRAKQHDFSIIQDVEIAERVARYLVRRSRFSATWKIAMGPEALLYRPFDVVTLNCQETNDTDTDVRITSMEITPEGIVLLELLEEDSSIYDTSSPLGTPVTQLDPSSHDPSAAVAVTNLTVTATTVSGSADSASNALLVEWDDPGGFVERTEVQYRVNGTTEYATAAPSRVDLTDALISPVEGGTLYDVRVRHVTRFGIAGAWSSTTQTSGNLALVPAGRVDGISAGQNLLTRIMATERTWTTTFGPTFVADIADLGLEVGDVIAASGEIRRASGSNAAQLIIEFRDSGGSTLGGGGGSGVKSIGTSYSLEKIFNASVPATATEIRVYFNVTNDGVTWYQRRLMLNRGPVPLPFEEPPLRVNRGEAEEGADVTGDHAADVDVLLTQNAPADAAASKGVIDASSANTDGNITSTSSATWTTAQTLSVTLAESTTIALTCSMMLDAQSTVDGDYFCTVRVMRDTTELGGLSSFDFGIPGISRIHTFVYRRVMTLAAGTYDFDMEFKKAGTVNANARARVITVEELR